MKLKLFVIAALSVFSLHAMTSELVSMNSPILAWQGYDIPGDPPQPSPPPPPSGSGSPGWIGYW